MNAEHIQAELALIAPVLAQVPKKNVYTVPQGYFEKFPSNLLDTLKTRDTIDSASLPLSVPPGYFETLPMQILERIKAAEQLDVQADYDELADTPILKSLPKREVYAVPEGYFEALRPLDRLRSTGLRKAIVHPLNRISRYMAAAVIIGFLAVAGRTLLKQENPGSGTEQVSSSHNFKFNPGDVQQLSEHEINEFLVTQSTPDAGSLNGINTEVDISGNLQKIPEEEIQEYLKENPLPGEPNSDG